MLPSRYGAMALVFTTQSERSGGGTSSCRRRAMPLALTGAGRPLGIVISGSVESHVFSTIVSNLDQEVSAGVSLGSATRIVVACRFIVRGGGPHSQASAEMRWTRQNFQEYKAD
jgi:hypothetical protein